MTTTELHPARDRLVLVLDVDSWDAARDLVTGLRPWFATAKVGLELYATEGPDVFDRVHDQGMSVFADLKLHDIPTQVGRAARVLGGRGVDFLNFHTSGGVDMVRAGIEGLREGADSIGVSRPVGLGVTVLTSQADTASFDQRLAVARESGCDGVVCSAFEAPIAKSSGLSAMVPGVRFRGEDTHDQARVATPTEAVSAGADWLVIGRAVTHATDREAAARRVADEVAAVVS